MLISAKGSNGSLFTIRGEPSIGAIGMVEWKRLANASGNLFSAAHSSTAITIAAPLTLHFKTGSLIAHTQIVCEGSGGDIRVEAWAGATCTDGSAVNAPAHCMNMEAAKAPTSHLFVAPSISVAGSKYYDDLIISEGKSSATITGAEDYKRAKNTSYIIRLTPILTGTHRATFKINWVETVA
jgi:hypothetical protein